MKIEKNILNILLESPYKLETIGNESVYHVTIYFYVSNKTTLNVRRDPWKNQPWQLSIDEIYKNKD